MKLNELKIGQCARITSVGGEGALRQHFLDMGVIPGAEVTLVKLAAPRWAKSPTPAKWSQAATKLLSVPFQVYTLQK